MKSFSKIIIWLCSIGFLCAIIGIFAVVLVVAHYSKDLPDHEALLDYKPPIVTRVHAGDGQLLTEFSREKRIFVPVEFIPDLVKHAFISAEDKTFYTHHGLDYLGIVSAAITNVRNMGTDRRLIGASTITQQIAKNFLLTNEQRFERKIREAILAIRMEQVMSKDHLLELYLNEIFLGGGAYGVAAAAQEYFDKALPELEIHEVAYLAALPKAPSRLQIDRNPEMAKERRDWVIGQMLDNGYISADEAEQAIAQPLKKAEQQSSLRVSAAYFAEEVRRELAQQYGEDALYYGGLSVRTTLDPELQKIAVKALRDGLLAYERRHDYPGPVAQLSSLDGWEAAVLEIDTPAGTQESWLRAVVLNDSAEIGLETGERVTLDNKDWAWMRGKMPPRSVILVEPREESGGEASYHLRWIPKVQGALVAIDPHTGRILAMQGGWSTAVSSFNRVTQAERQPGSAFKPFVYLSALDKGFTPATLVLDAPLVIDQGPNQKKWRPRNYSGEFYGPTPIRVGVEKSRNLMTVRLADFIGMEAVSDTARQFGIADNMRPFLSYALGAAETTLLELTSAYGMLVNGGKEINPTMIDRIQDRYGETIFKHDKRVCYGCSDRLSWDPEMPVPEIEDNRKQVADPRRAYQIVSILEGVVQRGTATRLRQLNMPVAGKTGTTNESRDAWFIGFTPDLVVGVYIGYDEPQTLGEKETGSSVAAPVFLDFMKGATKDVTPTPFRMPRGIRLVQINAENGTRAKAGDSRTIWEAFLVGNEPEEDVFMLDGEGIRQLPATSLNNSDAYGTPGQSTLTGTGGIY